MIVAPTHTEGLSGHSSPLSSPLQPGDHCSSSLGLLRPAMCLSDRRCQAVFTFLTPGVRLALEGLCPSRLSVHSHTGPPVLSVASRGFTGSFQWLASEAKPLCHRGSPSATVSGNYSPPLLSPLEGAALQEGQNACLSIRPFGLGLRTCNYVTSNLPSAPL